MRLPCGAEAGSFRRSWPTFFLLGKVLQDLDATPDEQVERARVKVAA
jgi:hypothetical protein